MPVSKVSNLVFTSRKCNFQYFTQHFIVSENNDQTWHWNTTAAKHVI